MSDSLNPSEMSFDAWAQLASSDEEAFESMRQKAIDDLIEGAPAEYQRRLRGLQWRVDQERRLAKSPVDSCMRISRLMWENVTGPRGLMESFRQINEALCQLNDACATLNTVKPLSDR